MSRVRIGLLLASLPLLLGSCFAARGGTMTVKELRATLQQLAVGWGLQPITCPEPFEVKENGLCYLLRETDAQFQQRIDAVDRKVLRPITGWRDDYGVMSAAFQYKQEMHEIGINLIRENNFSDGPEYAQLRAHKARAYVALYAVDEKPRDR